MINDNICNGSARGGAFLSCALKVFKLQFCYKLVAAADMEISKRGVGKRGLNYTKQYMVKESCAANTEDVSTLPAC